MRWSYFTKRKCLILLPATFFCILILWTVVGVASFQIQRNECRKLDFSTCRAGVNMGDAIQGDYVLFPKRNSIYDFPFVFGEKIVLYDIVHDKEWVVSHTVIPWGREGDDLIFHNSDVYMGATGSMLSDGDELKHVSLQSCTVEFIMSTGGLPDAYAVQDGILYYVDGAMDEDEKSVINILDPSEKHEERFFEDYIGSMAIFGNVLYWSNPKSKTLNLHNLRTGKRYSYSDIYDDASVIRRIDDNRVAVFYESGKVNIFENGKCRRLCSLSRQFFSGDTVTCRGNFLIFDRGRCIEKINCDTGEISTLIDLERYEPFRAFDWKSKSKPSIEVHYSDDYIVVVNRGARDEKIAIFDYDGTAIRIRDA